MSAHLDDRIWAGVELRLAGIEALIPEAPPWRPSPGVEPGHVRAVRLGGTLAPRSGASLRSRRRLAVALVVVALLVAALAGAIVSGIGRPPAVDPSSGPFGPLGLYRGSDSRANAAVLRDGRVLIVSGGWQGMGNAVARADLWAPATGTTRASPTLTARINPTVTLLLDGRALVVGGYGGPFQYASTALASGELFDPATGGWSVAGTMAVGRVGHTATLLADGRVLVIGGMGAGGTSAAAEIWDPATSAVKPAGTLGVGRSGHASVLLPNGQVLVAGGRDAAGNGVGVYEAWDPATGEFTQLGRYLDDPPHVTATRLPDGRVLVAGAWIVPGGFGGVDVQRVPSQASGDSTQLMDPRERHAATLLANGDVLVTGGARAGTNEAFDTAERWTADDGVFRYVARMERPAAGHSALLLPDGRVLIVLDGSGPEGFIEPFVYDPAMTP